VGPERQSIEEFHAACRGIRFVYRQKKLQALALKVATSQRCFGIARADHLCRLDRGLVHFIVTSGKVRALPVEDPHELWEFLADDHRDRWPEFTCTNRRSVHL
jgi:hypothetical protein